MAPGGVFPYKRLMGMYRWMRSHFHDCIDYNRVAFSIELLEWGHTFSDFGGKTVHIYGLQTYQSVCAAEEKSSVLHTIQKNRSVHKNRK